MRLACTPGYEVWLDDTRGFACPKFRDGSLESWSWMPSKKVRGFGVGVAGLGNVVATRRRGLAR